MNIKSYAWQRLYAKWVNYPYVSNSGKHSIRRDANRRARKNRRIFK